MTSSALNIDLTEKWPNQNGGRVYKRFLDGTFEDFNFLQDWTMNL